MSKANLTRRKLLKTSMGVSMAACLGGRSAIASTFPSRTISLIIPEGPGGTFDAYGREFAKVLTNQMGVHVEPINVEGGGGATAIFQLFSTKPDGYTISLINIPGLLTRKIPGNFNLDKLTWLANVGRNSEGLVVGAKSSINSVADMQKLSASRPIAFAMGGLGSSSYVATKVFAGATDINVKVVTGYKSSISSLIAVARGDVDAAIHPLSSIASMKDTSLIKLLVTFESKSSFPGVPSAIDIGQPDLVNVTQWQPVVAPPGVDPDIATTLSQALLRATNSPDVASWAAKIGTTPYALDERDTLAMLDKQKTLLKRFNLLPG